MKLTSSHTSLVRRSIAIALLTNLLIATTAAQTFEITSLTTADSNLIEHEALTGDDRGGIALSATSVFYTGDNATGSFPSANIANGSATAFRYDALVSNVRTRQVYALGTAFGIVQAGGDLVTRLVPLDPETGSELAGDITLSLPLSITSGTSVTGIFSGWDRIVLLDGSSLIAYNIDLPSGIVTSLGPVNLYADNGSNNDRCGCENWATWGVAEYSGGSIRLVYAASPNGSGLTRFDGVTGGVIKRYDVGSHSVSTLADFPNGLSDMCSFTVDPAANRWYFQYESYAGAFNFGTNESIGYATASFQTPSPSVAKITGRVMNVKGRGLSGVAVQAVSDDGKYSSTVTNTFGQYSLPKLSVGRTYTVSVNARRYYFPVSSEVVQLNEDIIGLDFEAIQ